MNIDFLIIGQGISGTMLSWFLRREGKACLVMDENRLNTSSKIAAGIINPVTGRRYVYTWMIDEVMPFAVKTYEEMSAFFNTTLVQKKNIIDFFPSAQMRNAFVERLTENDTYIHSYPDQNHFNSYFNYDFGCGEIGPAYIAQLPHLISLWRKELLKHGTLLEERFEPSVLETFPDKIRYKDVTAEKIIFCDGANPTHDPWFSLLPFAPNKGEALIIECPGLPHDHLFKKGLMLAPLLERDHFWVGSNYLWEFQDEGPTGAFYKHATSVLHHWLKLPFKVVDHKAGVRPATIERRPFVGWHPSMPSVGILNGMGTKGTSLAPFYAHQLMRQLVYGEPINREADIERFHRILTKSHHSS